MSERPFMAFLGGLGIGVATGLLLAPKSGAQTRAGIKDSVAGGQDYIRRQGAELSDAITGTVKRGRQAVKKTSEGVVQAFEEGKTAFQRSSARGPA